MTKLITGIVAIDDAGVIGQGGKLPWPQPPDDARIFVEATSGPQWLICGRRTWDALPKRARARMEARAVCLGRGPEDAPLAEIRAVLSTREREAVVIGGAQTYVALADLIDVWVVTSIPGRHEGDVTLPGLWDDWQLAATDSYPGCRVRRWVRDVRVYVDPDDGSTWRSYLSALEACTADGLPAGRIEVRLGAPYSTWPSYEVRL
jgi:dihydrofolate reductase